MPKTKASAIITVSLNPAIDRTIEVPNFTPGAHQNGREISRTAGGKGVNVSGVLRSLDVPSTVTGFLGAENRAVFDPFLNDPLVTDAFLVLDGRTRQNVTIADPASGTETHIRDDGLAIDQAALANLAEKLRSLAGAESIVIFSGSLPPGVGPGDLADLVETCASAGARVAVDTSGDAIRAMAGRKLWLIKPNSMELAQLAGRELPDPADELTAARSLTADVRQVLLSRGGEGACLFTNELALHGRVAVAADRIRNTVGCGDALLGAMVAGLWQGLDLRDAFRLSIACSAASACTIRPAEFQHDVMKEFSRKVTLNEL
ncbi:MAG: 1-phosphofructokinase family hexose kinase [Planctomycetota bacterium]|nr:1-phosphofructokinase family hexose kinase [Planctomycetota bacterium]